MSLNRNESRVLGLFEFEGYTLSSQRIADRLGLGYAYTYKILRRLRMWGFIEVETRGYPLVYVLTKSGYRERTLSKVSALDLPPEVYEKLKRCVL